MSAILGALDPTQFWILVLTLWCGIVAVIGCTIWSVSEAERDRHRLYLLLTRDDGGDKK